MPIMQRNRSHTQGGWSDTQLYPLPLWDTETDGTSHIQMEGSTGERKNGGS